VQPSIVMHELKELHKQHETLYPLTIVYKQETKRFLAEPIHNNSEILKIKNIFTLVRGL
jgi:hypothetical protein